MFLAEHGIEASRLAERAFDCRGELARAVRTPRGSGRRVPEPGRGRARDQRVKRQCAPVLRGQAMEGLDLLAHVDRVRGERMILAHPPAAPAGIGEHMRERLEIDFGGA